MGFLMAISVLSSFVVGLAMSALIRSLFLGKKPLFTATLQGSGKGVYSVTVTRTGLRKVRKVLCSLEGRVSHLVAPESRALGRGESVMLSYAMSLADDPPTSIKVQWRSLGRPRACRVPII